MVPIEQARTLLLNGKLVAIPTETVYGLGADAKNALAVQKIYSVKGRPAINPLIIHIPNSDAMIHWAIEIPQNAWKLAEAFWPGPLTLILKRHPDLPKIVTGGQDTVALRVPNHPLTLALLSRFGGGIAAPSANRYGRISPTTAQHVAKAFEHEVDYILDGGPCTVGIESTIVSLIDPAPVILRYGNISALDLTRVLDKTPSGPTEQHTLIVPGSNTSHYAPLQPLYLIKKEMFIKTLLQFSAENKKNSVLSFSEKPTTLRLSIAQWICMPTQPQSYAQQLYQQLHALDKEKSDCIVVEAPPQDDHEWLAINDRLQRAAHRA
jgi:L-threonylcarbamoyladenylate synthase